MFTKVLTGHIIFFGMVRKVLKLIFAGCLVGFFLSGCGVKKESFLNQYKERNLVKDKKGNYYKIVYRSKSPYGCDVFIYKSDDGQNWSKTGKIPSYGHETYKAWGYSLAYDEDKNILGFVYIGTGKGKKAVYFTKSLDNGKTWSKPVPINDDIWAERRYPKIAIKGENIFVVWQEEPESFSSKKKKPSGIYFCSSYDGGKNWNKNIWIRKGETPYIKVGKDGFIYLTYVGGENQNIIYLSYSKDKGKTWYTQAPPELPLIVKEPYISFSSKSIYLIFQGIRPNISQILAGTNYKLYYLKSDDKGKTWSKIIKLEEE